MMAKKKKKSGRREERMGHKHDVDTLMGKVRGRGISSSR